MALVTNFQVTKTGANPAAGAEVSDTVPAGKIWVLKAVAVTLVATGVANRRVNVTIDDGTTEFYRDRSGTDITDGQTRAIQAETFGGAKAVDTTVTHYLILPLNLTLGPGYRIKTVTENIQVGDNYGAPTYIVDEYSTS